MRLRQLTGLEQDKLRAEYEELLSTIEDLMDILDNKDRRMGIIKTETNYVVEKYGDDRRSEINFIGGSFRIEDMIPDEKVVITISHAGYIKRTPLLNTKHKPWRCWSKSINYKKRRLLEHLFVGTNHQYAVFHPKGEDVFWLRVFEIPEDLTSKGRAIQNLINIEQDDKVMAFILTGSKDEDYINSHYVIMATKGQVKKTSLEQYSRPDQMELMLLRLKMVMFC